MNDLLTEIVDLAAGAVLLLALLIVWRRNVTAQVKLLATQGAALGLLVLGLAIGEASSELAGVAVVVVAVKAVVLPLLIFKSRPVFKSRSAKSDTEVDTSVNPAAALLVSALLIALAFLVSRPLIALRPVELAQAIPVGFAVVFIGFQVLVSRRRAAAQVIGFVLIDNGIAVVAFLTTTGVPLIVELGAALTVLLAVVILQVLSIRMQRKFGDTDLDDLTALRDS